jgi:hypothetical protein
VRLAQVVEPLAGEADAAGDAQQALEWTRRWAAMDPLAEAPARSLMARLAASGERSAALSVYARLRERMRLELGVSAAAETRAVAASLRGPEADATALPEPKQDDSLVGRAGELQRLDDLRRAGRGGVVLLSGEGGIGKTRRVRGARHRRGGAVHALGRAAARPDPQPARGARPRRLAR